MFPRRFYRHSCLTSLVLGLVVAGLMQISPAAHADNSATITAVNVVAVTGSQALISFSYSYTTTNSGTQPNLDYEVRYGPNPATGQTQTYPYPTQATNVNAQFSASSGDTFSGSAQAQIPASGALNPSTTYHFIILLKDMSQTPPLVLSTSADRTFATTSASGNSASLTMTDIKTYCIDTRCQVGFSTSQSAQVELRWGPIAQSASTFGSYPNSVSETGPNTGFRALLATGLTASTTYHYALRATAQNNAQTTTGDFTMTTGRDSTDHTFSTGSCAGGVAIGACSADHLLCTAGGNLVADCSSVCGYACPTGTTCSTGGQCFSDPVLNGAPNQCNAANCYDANGHLLNPAPPGCYASWPQCNANTIIKVQKDRGCNLWLTCATTIQTTATSSAPAQNLCLSLAACNSLNSNGQCNHYLPPGQCSNDPLRFCNNDTDCLRGGTCNTPTADQPTQSLQDLTFRTPEQVSDVANLSGNVLTGLDWHQQGGSAVIQGGLPWQLMQQIGGDSQLKDGDFEYNPPNVVGWVDAPNVSASTTSNLSVDLEDRNSSPNHVLTVNPQTQVVTTGTGFGCSNNAAVVCRSSLDTSTCGAGNTCVSLCKNLRCLNDATRVCLIGANCVVSQNAPLNFSGAASTEFNASGNEYYYAQARIRGVSGSTPVIRMQFGTNSYSQFSVTSTTPSTCSNDATRICQGVNDCDTSGSGIVACVAGKSITTNSYVDIPVTSAWQRVTLGPLKGLSGGTRLAFVCLDSATCGKFQIDDVIVKPFLQTTSNGNFIEPSCRLYPKDDSPSCDYTDTSGTIYQGWHGYCLEHDSQTGTCLSWWPVDLIKGENNVFGTEQAAGYHDQSPLYLCAQAAGSSGPNEFNSTKNYTVAYGYDAYINPAGSRLCYFGNFNDTRANLGDFTLASCDDGGASTSALYAEVPGTANSCAWSGTMDCTDKQLKADSNLYESQIVEANWTSLLARPNSTDTDPCHLYPCPTFKNNKTFQDSSSTNLADKASDGTWTEYREKPTDAAANGAHNDEVWWRFIWNGGLLNDDLVLRFDATTGRFLGYRLHAQDTDSSFSDRSILPAVYRVTFTVNELCTNVVQVVDSNGTNAAWANRVNSTSYAAATGLGYTRNTDLLPFGSVVTPNDSPNDPTKWPLMPIQLKDSSNYSSSPTGQARGGAPYACNGNCASYVCTKDLTNNCHSPADILACQTHKASDGITLDPGECTGVSSTLAANQGAQVINTTTGTCSIGGAACNIDTDCGGTGGVCNLKTSSFGQNGIMRLFARAYGAWTLVNGTYIIDPGAKLWNPPTALCPLNTANACAVTQKVCAAAPKTITVTAADKDSAVALGTSQCQATIACDGRSNADQCKNQGSTVNYGYFANYTCTSNTNGSFSCTGSCVLNSSKANTYNQATYQPASKYTRPAYPNDYCAIPPNIGCAGVTCPAGQLATFLNGTSNIAKITGGSGSIGIKFNSFADPDQLPLGRIFIDWGDGQQTLDFPFAPRSDPSSPHVYTHVYIANKGDTANCSASNGLFSCDYHIHIQISDNWGWCSSAVNGANCPGKPATWPDTGLIVHVSQ